MRIEAASYTWGISGPTFLLVYGILAVAVLIASISTRRRLAEPMTGNALEPDVRRHPHDLAYLNGGAQLAVGSALAAMHLRGTIVSERGVVHAVGRLDAHPDDLERAIHRTAAHGMHRSRLFMHRDVSAALAATRDRLVDAGLMLSGARRARIRRVGSWMLAVGVLGLVRLLAGVADARPVGFLLAALAAVGVVAVAQLLVAPRRSRAGDRTLARLRTEQHGLAPKMRPDWTVYGPEGAALGIGIFGMSAIWASDPAFASELALTRSDSSGGATATGGGDGGSGGGSSGCGGGGGCGGG